MEAQGWQWPDLTSLSKAEMLVVFTEQVSVECRKRSSQEFLGNAATWACVCGLVMEHEGKMGQRAAVAAGCKSCIATCRDEGKCWKVWLGEGMGRLVTRMRNL